MLPWLAKLGLTLLENAVVHYFTSTFTEFTSPQQRRRFYIFIVISLIACLLAVYAILETQKMKNQQLITIEEFSQQTLRMTQSADSLRNSIAKEIHTCGEGVYTGKMDFAKMVDSYVFSFSHLMDSSGRDVRYDSHASQLLYVNQHKIGKEHKFDMAMIEMATHGTMTFATRETLEAQNSEVFNQFFTKTVLHFSKIYYMPYFYTRYDNADNAMSQSLLSVVTLSIVDENMMTCDPKLTLGNIFKYLEIYYLEQADIRNLKISEI